MVLSSRIHFREAGVEGSRLSRACADLSGVKGGCMMDDVPCPDS